MSLPNGATFAHGELERIKAAIADLEKAHDEPTKHPHPVRELTVKISLHVHRDYPKMLYKGAGTANTKLVNNAEEEQAAVDAGYSPTHTPEVA